MGPILAIRLPYTWVRALLREPLGLDDVSELDSRVWIADSDLYLHLNNGRYLTLCDLGRTDLCARIGILGTCVRNRWQPVAGATSARYRRSIGVGRRYRLDTRIAAWDEHYWYFDQRFVLPGELLAARAFVKVTMKAADGGLVPTAGVLEATGLGRPRSPRPDAELAAFIDASSRPVGRTRRIRSQ